MLREIWPHARFSSVYNTTAREFEDQPDFLNAVVEIETKLEPHAVLKRLQEIESSLGKAPPFKFGPRTIDLDLLLYDDLILDDHDLVIPHPRMHQRRFVLEPLCELLDEKKWRDFLEQTQQQSCCKVNFTL